MFPSLALNLWDVRIARGGIIRAIEALVRIGVGFYVRIVVLETIIAIVIDLWTERTMRACTEDLPWHRLYWITAYNLLNFVVGLWPYHRHLRLLLDRTEPPLAFQSSSAIALLSSDENAFRDFARAVWKSSVSLPLVIGPPILKVRARPFGLSAKVGARGLCLPRALPPIYGISYATARTR